MKAIAFVLLAACGAQPNQPVLANVPRPNPTAVAGVAAAAAAAITLASPDTAGAKPEKNHVTEKKPVKVKESVPSSVLDRLDKAEQQQPAGHAAPDAPQPTPAALQTEPNDAKKNAPKDALDFSQLRPVPGQPAQPR